MTAARGNCKPSFSRDAYSNFHRLNSEEQNMMIAHVSIGVRDLARAKRFYDAALKPLGYECLWEREQLLGYGPKSGKMGGKVAFWIAPVERPVPADVKSGLHFCFAAAAPASADAFHAAALSAGGRDNGAPGLRAEYGPGYYAAFVVDPDGYRIEAYCDQSAS
jgi:catechol 2,3-dioxygenase-like lactoylglutathione lyase family enzyme